MISMNIWRTTFLRSVISLRPSFATHANFHQTVYAQKCRSWYKMGKEEGRIVGLWPGSCLHAVTAFSDPRWEDFNYKYVHKNRFAFLGNGDVKATASRDVLGLSPYIRSSDYDWSVE